jgi:hypothetical protein
VFEAGRQEHIAALTHAMSNGAAKCAKGMTIEDEDREMEVEEGGDLGALD